MKIKNLFNVAMVTMMVMVMASCGTKTPTPEQVAGKIDAKETLSQADYKSILEYCGEYAKKAQPYFDLINTQPNDSTEEYIRASTDMAALYAEYPYLDMFRSVVYNLPAGTLDDANKKLVDEYTRYQAFPLPEGSGVDMTNPDVVGDIVDMPDNDSGNVIATGDGEAVNVDVK